MSLWVFSRGIWQDKDLDPGLHYDLCQFLQGAEPYSPWVRALVAGFRGSLKSSVVGAWMGWKGLYGAAAGKSLEDVARYLAEHEIVGIKVEPGVCIPNWSCLLVHQRYQNAEAKHEVIQNKFKFGPQAALLQDLYRERLPTGFEEWTKGRTIFNRTDANAAPAISTAGLDSKLESIHVDALIGDDLEGADAEKSDAPNVDSYAFATERSTPLLKDPVNGQVLVVGTSHGDDPLIWQIRKEEEGGTLENSRRKGWKLWWQEVVDPSTGQTRWPKRFTQEWVERQQELAKKSPGLRKMWDKQYMLRQETEAGRMFDMTTAERTSFRFENGFVMRYLANSWQQGRYDKGGMLIGEPEWRHTTVAQCRAFIHVDPLHRDTEDMKQHDRPRTAAVIVTLVSPDLHIFVADVAIKEMGLDELTETFFLMYRKWAPYRFTVDTVGAQIWFKNWLRLFETTKYQHVQSLPRPWRPPRRLPLPSSLFVEAHKGNLGKEEFIVQQLEIPLNLGLLHLNKEHVELWAQMEKFPSATYACDGLDALAQGPIVWDKFLGVKDMAALRAKAAMMRQYRTIEPLTGYVRGFPDEGPPGRPAGLPN